VTQTTLDTRFDLMIKNNIFFNIITTKSLNWFIRIDFNYLFGSFEITSIRLYTLLRSLFEPDKCSNNPRSTTFESRTLRLNVRTDRWHLIQRSFYTCFDWFKKLRLFVNVWNRKIDVVLQASRSVVISWFSLNEEPLGLFKDLMIFGV
jgi:hypothetical protein